jgi:phosphate-selective porin
MAFNHGSAAKILLDGFNASNVLNEVSEEGEQDNAEVTVLGDSAKSYIPGLRDATVKMSGFYDHDVVTDANAFSYKINSLLRQETHATYLPAGDTLGGPAYLLKGILSSDEISASVDDAAEVDIEFQNCTGMESGKTLHPLAARTATGSATGIDNSAPSTNGLSAVLHVTAVSGTATPTVTVKIQHSSDSTNGVDGAWVDLATFAAATAKGSQYVSVTGTVNDYVRAQWTITGTTPSLSFHVAARRK